MYFVDGDKKIYQKSNLFDEVGQLSVWLKKLLMILNSEMIEI